MRGYHDFGVVLQEPRATRVEIVPFAWRRRGSWPLRRGPRSRQGAVCDYSGLIPDATVHTQSTGYRRRLDIRTSDIDVGAADRTDAGQPDLAQLRL